MNCLALACFAHEPGTVGAQTAASAAERPSDQLPESAQRWSSHAWRKCRLKKLDFPQEDCAVETPTTAMAELDILIIQFKVEGTV
jgi:hypothetical protein